MTATQTSEEKIEEVVQGTVDASAEESPFSLELSQDQKDIREWVHGFAEGVMRPAAHEWDEKEEFPWPILQEAAKIGLYGFEGTAQFWADPTGLTLPIVSEEQFWGDAGIGMALNGTGLAVSAIAGQGTPEQMGEWIPQCYGTEDDTKIAAFCASEPDAGSDMARLRCKGEQDADGNWFVSGSKLFVTSGHGKYHFVIARTEAAGDPDDPFAGLKGLSMFLVPTYEDLPDGSRRRIVPIDRVEEKLGHHGSATCNLSFDRAPARLIGKRGEGFRLMLTLMNNARIGVGFESLGLCEAAWRLAADYASVRCSMGKPIAEHELIADKLDAMRTTIQGIRALAVESAWCEEMAQKLKLQLQFDLLDGAERAAVERRRRRLARRSRRLTPLLKYLAAEQAVAFARDCVQIHGGVGYTTEYGAEKLLRDAMVFPIYEGTSQIQALMAMKDALLGIMKAPRRFLARLARARWQSLSGRDALARRVAKLQSLSCGAQQHLLTRTASDKFRSLQGTPLSAWPASFFKSWNPKRDFSYAQLHAEKLTELLAHEAIAELLLDQARRHPERREVLERYLERAEPRCRFLHDAILTTGGGLLARLAGLRRSAEPAATLAGV